MASKSVSKPKHGVNEAHLAWFGNSEQESAFPDDWDAVLGRAAGKLEENFGFFYRVFFYPVAISAFIQ